MLSTSTTTTITVRGEQFKPDVVLYNRTMQTETGIAAILELKSPETQTTVPPGTRSDEVKQLLTYLHAVLTIQGFRNYVYGILTNHKYLVFAEARREKGHVRYYLHYAAQYQPEYIQWLCTASLATLGLQIPNVTMNDTTHVLDQYLGSGQYSHGFELKLGDDTVVIKCFLTEDMAKKEREVCTAFSAIPGATHLYRIQPKEGLFVAVTPKGLPFHPNTLPITIKHVQSLMETLDAVHSLGFTHGDICSSNIYYLDHEKALLNDWSHVEKLATDDARDADVKRLIKTVEALGGASLVSYSIVGMEPTTKKHRVV